MTADLVQFNGTFAISSADMDPHRPNGWHDRHVARGRHLGSNCACDYMACPNYARKMRGGWALCDQHADRFVA